jgi:hypothetical protein
MSRGIGFCPSIRKNQNGGKRERRSDLNLLSMVQRSEEPKMLVQFYLKA